MILMMMGWDSIRTLVTSTLNPSDRVQSTRRPNIILLNPGKMVALNLKISVQEMDR